MNKVNSMTNLGGYFRRFEDVIVGTFLLLFFTGMYIESSNIKTLTFASIGPAFMPKITSVCLIILSVILIAGGVRKALNATSSKEVIEQNEETPSTKNDNVRVLLTLLSIIIYFLLLNPLGFVLSSILYLFSQMVLLSKNSQRRYVLFGIVSVVVSVSVYLIFRYVLYLLLPIGILG
ncbi:tripartite tricarboxylate transporter TctB family protein [Bacillus sp. Marseille-P3661]|uniref:tripartite tricarboxylate transporter TctB family protein n=1 Tax=Bacillus sp. Marseille-P3661 TaxID=1936234 RepID=UPI000C81B8FE|nr:tripartite tricarboxylate transporter TctB family protein [Bacillus sp. Marseille-P3661]